MNLNSVCVLLGPYRNLTTLLSSMMFLHPNCQVLNHAGDRVYQPSVGEDVNFIDRYSEETLDNFVDYALRISREPTSGWRGGSITVSHAFIFHPKMVKTYNNRYGSSLIKSDIRCLWWKESMKTTLKLMHDDFDFDLFLKKSDPRVKFLLPIRNPMDCAISNSNNGQMWPMLSPSRSEQAILNKIVEIIKWFTEWRTRYPDRFFYITEYDLENMLSGTLFDVANFLKIDYVDEWVDDVRTVCELKTTYPHPDGLQKHYDLLLNTYFGNFADFKHKLSLMR